MSEDVINQYFSQFVFLPEEQQAQIGNNLSLWARCGLLQLACDLGFRMNTADLGEGRSIICGSKNQPMQCTLNPSELEKETKLHERFGPLAVVSTKIGTLIEVRLNIISAHGFGHQLLSLIDNAVVEKIETHYKALYTKCETNHPAPPVYSGSSEIIEPDNIHSRCFISGYATTSMHEYWAESVAAFSTKESRDVLAQLDPEMYQILTELITNTPSIVHEGLRQAIIDHQTRLRNKAFIQTACSTTDLLRPPDTQGSCR